MKIIVVGIDHELQTPGQTLMSSGPLPAAEQADKTQFQHLVFHIASSQHVSIVAEEQLPPRATIPRNVAATLKVRHEYVDMPADERERRGIPNDYATNPKFDDALVRCYHDQREAWWVERLEAVAKAGDICILVCGWGHLDAVSSKLRARGHKVEVVDLRGQPGFDLRWLRDSPRRTSDA